MNQWIHTYKSIEQLIQLRIRLKIDVDGSCIVPAMDTTYIRR